MAVGVVLAMLVPLVAALSIAGGGDACPGVRFMTRNETCLAGCTTTPALCDLCRDTLANVSSGDDKAEEVTVYALAAARRAARAYDETVDKAERLIVGGALASRDEREIYQRCIASYGAARGEVAGVEADLAGCELARTRREYGVALAAVADCGEALQEMGSPLRKRNAADRDLTEVAAALGGLVLGGLLES